MCSIFDRQGRIPLFLLIDMLNKTEITHRGKNIILITPPLYMNLSGKSRQLLDADEEISCLENMLVILMMLLFVERSIYDHQEFTRPKG